MKRVSVDSHQSQPGDVNAKARFKHQILLQDYLELQKEFVLNKKKLHMAKQKKETLQAEVRFLKQRHGYLLKIKSDKFEPEQDLVRLQNADIQGRHGIDEAVLKNTFPILDTRSVLGDEEYHGGKKEEDVRGQLRLEKKRKSCLINDKRVGKKKVSWQDQVASGGLKGSYFKLGK